MPRVRTRFPTVFIGHPFGNRFPVKKFRKLFRELPFKVIYGNTDIQTEHLLKIMQDNIANSDYAIFDLSDWNSNVSLELGLAHGLKRKPSVPYYILLNTRRSKEVPADVRGLQRLEYTRYDYRPEIGLGNQLINFILSKEYWVKQLKKRLSNREKADKKIFVALRIVAYLRDNEKLGPDNMKSLRRGSRLRREDLQEVLELLRTLKILRRTYNSSSVYVKGASLFYG